MAIKSVSIEGRQARARLAAIATEATIATNLVHPNIVATYTHGLSARGDSIEHTPAAAAAGLRPPPISAAKYLLVQARPPAAMMLCPLPINPPPPSSCPCPVPHAVSPPRCIAIVHVHPDLQLPTPAVVGHCPTERLMPCAVLCCAVRSC